MHIFGQSDESGRPKFDQFLWMLAYTEIPRKPHIERRNQSSRNQIIVLPAVQGHCYKSLVTKMDTFLAPLLKTTKYLTSQFISRLQIHLFGIKIKPKKEHPKAVIFLSIQVYYLYVFMETTALPVCIYHPSNPSKTRF